MPIKSRLRGLQWLAELANPRPLEATNVLPRTSVVRQEDGAGGGTEPAGESVPGVIGLQDVRLQALLRGAGDMER